MENDINSKENLKDSSTFNSNQKRSVSKFTEDDTVYILNKKSSYTDFPSNLKCKTINIADEKKNKHSCLVTLFLIINAILLIAGLITIIKLSVEVGDLYKVINSMKEILNDLL